MKSSSKCLLSKVFTRILNSKTVSKVIIISIFLQNLHIECRENILFLDAILCFSVVYNIIVPLAVIYGSAFPH